MAFLYNCCPQKVASAIVTEVKREVKSCYIKTTMLYFQKLKIKEGTVSSIYPLPVLLLLWEL